MAAPSTMALAASEVSTLAPVAMEASTMAQAASEDSMVPKDSTVPTTEHLSNTFRKNSTRVKLKISNPPFIHHLDVLHQEVEM